MPEEITLIERPEQHALCISETVGTMKLSKVMGPAYLSIMKHLESQGIECSEKNIPFTVYKNIDWDRLNKKGLLASINMMFFHKWEMDIGIPSPEKAAGAGNIKKTKRERGKYIRAIQKRPYMKVGETYKKISAHALENNLNPKNYSIEFYMNDPRKVNATDLETEVLVHVS